MSAVRELGLTRRQTQVAELVVRGWTNAQVAAELHLTPETVKYHIAAALKRTGTMTRTELAAVWWEAHEKDAVDRAWQEGLAAGKATCCHRSSSVR